MNIEKVLGQVDALYEENKGAEAERLMQESIAAAVGEQDDESLLQLLNELLGYYRETSQKENAFRIAGQAIAQAERMGLKGTLPYATTLLNVANAFRAGGRLSESLALYQEVQRLYEELLAPDHMFMAGLQNNISLLYQEMGEYGKAKECQLEALQIARDKDAAYELGVTYANLAATCVQMGDTGEGYHYAREAVQVFQGMGVEDSHYGAALAALGACCYQEGRYQEAYGHYRLAMELVERGIGRNEAYYRLKEHVENCRIALGESGGQVTSRELESQEAVSVYGEKTEGASRELESQDTVSEGREKMEGTSQELGDKETEGLELEETCGLGLVLAREYYETYGRPMIREQFPAYEEKIAVGLVGRGSDCFGYDDAVSRDHDWGPEFCMWVTEETYEAIGEALQAAYDKLPTEYRGYRRGRTVSGRNRRGVLRIPAFYKELTGAAHYEELDWRQVHDYGLAEAVNGQVFRDDEGVFSAYRQKLMQGYPMEIQYLKLAEGMARVAQALQYNSGRVLSRGDTLSARMFVWEGIREAMKLQHYMEGTYPPHDKWLHRSLQESASGRRLEGLLLQLADAASRILGALPGIQEHPSGTVLGATGGKDGQEMLSGAPVDWGKEVDRLAEQVGSYFAMELYGRDWISDIDPYLDAHSKELLYKASLCTRGREELAQDIAKLEFEAFDKVHNEGGRASCQNDWPTFSIMRKSQYLTWNRTMLLQYLYDFHREYARGHNLIEEKYGRMMESTAPEAYEKIKDHFPLLTKEKKAIINQICSMQVAWMEEFARQYPSLADNARSIHTYEDNPFDTSYETYLRGELGTYSDKMLELYGRYVVAYAREGKNLAEDIMTNSVRMYGYGSLEEAEHKIQW